MPDTTASIANNNADPNYARKRALVDLQRLLACMERDPSPPNISWHAIWMRAELASDLMETLRQNALPSDHFEYLGQRVERCSTQAKEIAMSRKSQERDLVEEIFFRTPAPTKPESSEEEAPEQGSAQEEVPEVEERQQKQPPDGSSSDQQRPMMSNQDLAQEQRELLEEEISLMAEQLKHSTQKMNTTLKSQSQHLGQMQELAEENVDKVGRAASDVQQHVSTGWRRTFFTWTLIVAVFGTFVFCIMTMKLVPKRASACIPFLTCLKQLGDDHWCRTLPDGHRYCGMSEHRDRSEGMYDTGDPVKVERRREQGRNTEPQQYYDSEDSYSDDGTAPDSFGSFEQSELDDDSVPEEEDHLSCGSGESGDCDAAHLLYGDGQEEDEGQHRHAGDDAGDDAGDCVGASEQRSDDDDPVCEDGDDCDATAFLYSEEVESVNDGSDEPQYVDPIVEGQQIDDDVAHGEDAEIEVAESPEPQEESGTDGFDAPQDVDQMVEGEQTNDNEAQGEDSESEVPESPESQEVESGAVGFDEPEGIDPMVEGEHIDDSEANEYDSETEVAESPETQEATIAEGRTSDDDEADGEESEAETEADESIEPHHNDKAEDHRQVYPRKEGDAAHEAVVQRPEDNEPQTNEPQSTEDYRRREAEAAAVVEHDSSVMDEQQQIEPLSEAKTEEKERDMVARDATTSKRVEQTGSDQDKAVHDGATSKQQTNLDQQNRETQEEERKQGGQDVSEEQAETAPKRQADGFRKQPHGDDETVEDRADPQQNVQEATSQREDEASQKPEKKVEQPQATAAAKMAGGSEKAREGDMSSKEEKKEPPKQPRDNFPNISPQQIRTAASQCRLILLRKLVQRRPDLANAADGNGFTPMHEAAVSGCTNELKFLLEHVEGIDVNQRTWDSANNQPGSTALWWVKERGMADDHPVIKLLLEKGAVSISPNLKVATEGEDQTPATPEMPDDVVDFSPEDIRVASFQGELESVKSMLKRKPEWVNVADQNGWTALHEAVRSHQIKVVRVILDHGMDINARVGPNHDGPTATSMAVESFGTEDPLVLFLLRRGGHS